MRGTSVLLLALQQQCESGRPSSDTPISTHTSFPVIGQSKPDFLRPDENTPTRCEMIFGPATSNAWENTLIE